MYLAKPRFCRKHKVEFAGEVMIGIRLNNHQCYNEMEDIIRMYYGKCEIERLQPVPPDGGSSQEEPTVLITSILEQDSDGFKCTTEYRSTDRQEIAVVAAAAGQMDKKAQKRLVKKSVYKLLALVFEKEFPWGILTGIRPVKIVHELLDGGVKESEITGKLTFEYLMSSSRAQLALETAKAERPFIYPCDESSVSIYVGIPFCPSRCHYCSFTSNSISACGAYVEPYLESLMKEIRTVAEYLGSNSYWAQSVYIGGGTPTSLSASQLDRLLKCIGESFGSRQTEFTCEAGRPDSITPEKLTVLKANKVDRISINPQTMNDITLKSIGRAHSTEQLLESYKQARNTGFNNINMDLILGLPGEGIEQLKYTLDEVGKLGPESVTVHTMAIKRASVYNEEYNRLEFADSDSVLQMMDYAIKFLRDMGLHPYYLYRQKHMLQNLENIGFARKGSECLYNIQIMEERQTNVAFGADAVTKIVINSQNRIERQHNIKDVRLYIEKTDEMIKNKIDILGLLGKTY